MGGRRRIEFSTRVFLAVRQLYPEPVSDWCNEVRDKTPRAAPAVTSVDLHVPAGGAELFRGARRSATTVAGNMGTEILVE